jgi:hypothetical protein
VETPSRPSVIRRASPPSGRMRYSWYDAPPCPPPTAAGKYGAPGPLVGSELPRAPPVAAGASRSERNTNSFPSFDHAGDVSFLSAVKVSRRVLGSPSVVDTT